MLSLDFRVPPTAFVLINRVHVACRKAECLPQTTPPIHPYEFKWTQDKNDEIIALYVLKLLMEFIANKFCLRTRYQTSTGLRLRSPDIAKVCGLASLEAGKEITTKFL